MAEVVHVHASSVLIYLDTREFPRKVGSSISFPSYVEQTPFMLQR